MTSDTGTPADAGPEEGAQRSSSKKAIVLLVVVALFAGLALAKLVPPKAEPSASRGASLTSARNDAVADYDAALQTGRPIYVLFHSLS